MELTSPKVIKNLLEKYGARLFKGWGQNFLIDEHILKKIVGSANLKKSDIVLEIGPGIGTLTQELAKRVKPAPYRTRSGTGKVIAVEKDKRMCEILSEMLKSWDIRNVRIIQGEILEFNPKSYKLKAKSYKIVANLPFYIVAPVIRKFLESKNPPKEMILMVQKEVAQRICAKPPDMSILAVSVQFYAKPEILFYVSKSSFWPPPKVNGAILKIIPNRARRNVLRKLFFKVVRAGFSQPRKQLANNLSKELKLDKSEVKNWLLENKIEPSRRAETLSIKDWIKLTKNFQK